MNYNELDETQTKGAAVTASHAPIESGFWHTSGPKKNMSVAGGVIAGVAGAVFGGMGMLAASATGVGTIAVLWYGLNKISK